jgi:hypothetical protein
LIRSTANAPTERRVSAIALPIPAITMSSGMRIWCRNAIGSSMTRSGSGFFRWKSQVLKIIPT